MHACGLACIYVFVYERMYACMFVYMCVRAYALMFSCVCMHMVAKGRREAPKSDIPTNTPSQPRPEITTLPSRPKVISMPLQIR